MNKNNTQDSRVVPVPVYQAFIMSIHHTLVSALQMAWSQLIVTVRGKLNLLGIAFFGLTIISAYTANLAALMTIKHDQ